MNSIPIGGNSKQCSVHTSQGKKIFNVNDALSYGKAMISSNVKYTFTTIFVMLLL